MRYLVLSVLLSLPFAACASNIKDTDLLTSNTLITTARDGKHGLPPESQFLRQPSRDSLGFRISPHRQGLSGRAGPKHRVLHSVDEHRLLQPDKD